MSDSPNVNVSFENLVDSDEVNQEIIANINKLFGNNVKNLSKVSEHIQKLITQKSELEKNLQCATNKAPDRIATALNKAKDVLAQSKQLQDEVDTLMNEFTGLKKRSESLLSNVSEQIKIIREAENAKLYLQWISHIKEMNNAMPGLLKNLIDQRALNKYKELRISSDLLEDSKCLHLKKYLDDCVQHWHQILVDKVTDDFQSTMKLINWPFLQEGIKSVDISENYRTTLECNIEYLLYLDQFSWQQESTNDDIPGVVRSFEVSCLPIKLLLRPLEVRFFYHFSGKKATNSKENPQWYFTQILRWAALHEQFLEKVFQSLIRSHCDAKQEFFIGLTRLAAIKLAGDLSEIINEDELFSATVQETLNFDQEIRALGEVGDASIVRVLTQPDVFQKWRSLEEKFAHELLDEFVSSSEAFTATDEQGLCRCAEQLMLLLQGITNRCKQLPQPGHRIQFFEVQLEILDNFRVRILQLSKSHLSDPIAPTYCIFINTVHYICSTLYEWDDVPLFVELHYYKKRFIHLETAMRSSFIEETQNDSDDSLSKYIMDITAKENTLKRETIASFNLMESTYPDSKFEDTDGAAFAEMIKLYEHIENEMLHVIGNYLLTEFRARSQSYRREKWFGQSFSTISELKPVDISPSFCPMMEVLVKHIGRLKNSLHADIFSTVWYQLAKSLDKYIFEEVILDTNFSTLGSSQLNYDVTKGFWPIFYDYTRKPENSFPLVKESLILLTIPTPHALLLRDTLNLARDNKEFPSFNVSPVKALEERGIFNFTIKQAEKVLKLRIDLFAL